MGKEDYLFNSLLNKYGIVNTNSAGLTTLNSQDTSALSD